VNRISDELWDTALVSGRMLLLAVVLGALAFTCQGCGAGALGAQADTIAVAGATFAEADAILVRARAQDLDAVVDAAREECGENGCTPERQDFYRLELERRTGLWAPALACRDPIPIAMREWVDALRTAQAAATEGLGVALLMQHGVRFLELYTALVGCIEAVVPSLDLPSFSLGGGQ